MMIDSNIAHCAIGLCALLGDTALSASELQSYEVFGVSLGSWLFGLGIAIVLIQTPRLIVSISKGFKSIRGK